MKAFLRENFPKMSVSDLTLAFNSAFNANKTTGQILSTLSNHNIRCYRTTGQLNKGKNTLLNKEQSDFLRQEYVKSPLKIVVTTLNERFDTSFTYKQLRTFVKNHQIKCGRDSKFKPGNVPHHAGTKGLVKPNSGSFRKGHVSCLHPLGSERVNVNGYIEVKVANPNVWDLKHRVIWRERHGEINSKTTIRFKDGDRQNVDIDNLFAVDRSAHAILNNRYRFNEQPIEVKDSVILLAKIDAKLGKLK